MCIGVLSAKSFQKPRHAWLQLAMLLIMTCIGIVPGLAWAKVAIPMCSAFGECVEAPPPEVPPTGGEVRAPPRGLFEFGPSCERGPDRDSGPLPSAPAPLEPIALENSEGCPVHLHDCAHCFGHAPSTFRSAGVSLEIFRPPCTATCVCPLPGPNRRR